MSIGTGIYGLLTIASLAAVAVFGTIAFGYVARLRRRPPLADGDEIGQATRVLKNVRKGEPLTDAESAKARRVIADRRSVWAYSMPAGLISIGCFFVFGSRDPGTTVRGQRPTPVADRDRRCSGAPRQLLMRVPVCGQHSVCGWRGCPAWRAVRVEPPEGMAGWWR